jgi:hypothetical protein
MIGLHLLPRAVATCNRRGSPLEGPGMCDGPRFPPCQRIGREPPGARMPLKSVLNSLERQGDLGLLTWATRARQLCLPIQQRQQQFVHPLFPPRAQGYGLHIVPHRLPPHVNQSRNACALLAHRVQGALLARSLMCCDQRCKRRVFSLELAFNLLAGLAGRVQQTPGVHAQRQVGERGARGVSNGLPALHLGLAGLYQGLCLLRLLMDWGGMLATSPGAPALASRPAGLAADD